MVAAWDEKTGDSHYNLNQRNCVHFVQEAARRIGDWSGSIIRADEEAAFLSEGGGAGQCRPGHGDRPAWQGYLASLPPLLPRLVAPSPAPTQPVTGASSSMSTTDHKPETGRRSASASDRSVPPHPPCRGPGRAHRRRTAPRPPGSSCPGRCCARRCRDRCARSGAVTIDLGQLLAAARHAAAEIGDRRHRSVSHVPGSPA